MVDSLLGSRVHVDRSQHTVNTHADTHCHHPVLLAGGFRFSSLWSSAELWSSTAHRGQPAPFGSCRWLQRARYYYVSFRFTVWCCSVLADTFSHLPLHSHFHREGSYRRTQQPTLRKEMNKRPFISNTKLRSKTPPLSDLIDKSASVWSSWSSKWIRPEDVSLAQRASLPRLCDWCLLSGPELQVHNQSKWANACWDPLTPTLVLFLAKQLILIWNFLHNSDKPEFSRHNQVRRRLIGYTLMFGLLLKVQHARLWPKLVLLSQLHHWWVCLALSMP